jgi:hypothetical protein
MILQVKKGSKVVRVNVEDQKVEVRQTGTMEGAPTLEVTLNDPEWLVTDSDLLDLNADGRLDHVETKYNGEWYRIVEVSPRNDALTLTFEHRVVAILRKYKKPKKHRRVPGYTRAMFLKSLVQEARDDGNKIEFYSPRLHQRQQIAKGQTVRTPNDPTGERGFSKKQKLTVKGRRANKSQRKIAAQALAVADAHLSDAQGLIRWRVYMALMEALITESSITNLVGGDADSGGVLQVRRSVHKNVNVRDVEQVVTLFLTKGFAGKGGAITLANTTTKAPHEIAQAVQGSAFSDGSNYKEHEAEAKEWVKAYHVITDPNDLSQETTIDGAYYFSRGGANNSNEDSWDAMNRLAAEVNWRVFVRGNTVYYVEDVDLYKQKPVLELDRLAPRVIDVEFDWDEGKPVNTATIVLQRQDVRHGETIELADAGPASTRWLVWEVQREATGGFSTLNLRTPQAPKREPAPERESVTVEGTVSGKKSDAFTALINACKAVDRNTPSYLYGGGHGVPLDSLGPGTRFDCSSSTSWVLHKAGLFDHDTAWVSGDFAAKYGKPGQGKLFTVWANANHVWIEFVKGSGARYARFDTGGPRQVQSDRGVYEMRSGAHLSTQRRSTAGFTPRHFEGM